MIKGTLTFLECEINGEISPYLGDMIITILWDISGFFPFPFPNVNLKNNVFHCMMWDHLEIVTVKARELTLLGTKSIQ